MAHHDWDTVLPLMQIPKITDQIIQVKGYADLISDNLRTEESNKVSWLQYLKASGLDKDTY